MRPHWLNSLPPPPPSSRARFIVCAAHVHNYERFQRDNIVFLVSGGGGGKPDAVKRSAADLYQSDDFPNFHYLRFQLTAGQLRGEMVRLTPMPLRDPHGACVTTSSWMPKRPRCGVSAHCPAETLDD